MIKPFKYIAALATLTLCAALSGCGAAKDSKTIVVGASSAPHAEILEAARPALEKEGYKLEVKEFSDWVLPNTSLAAGEIDANYFQHLPFLEDFNKEHNEELVSAAAIHFEPLSLFSSKGDSYQNIKDGAKIGVPSDTTNEARSLLLLQKLGLIELKPDAGLSATKESIVSNPHNIEIVEAEAASLPRLLEDVDFAVINGNYALASGLDTSKIQATEDVQSSAAQEYANIVAVQKKDKDSDQIKALVKALQSDEVRKFVSEKYKGQVIVVF